MKKLSKIFSILLLILFAAGLTMYGYNRELKAVYDAVYSEAGVEIDIDEFLADPEFSLSLSEAESDKVNFHKPGEYDLTLLTSPYFRHRVKLIISDTIFPQAETVERVAEYGQTLTADEFVKNITDATDVVVSYAKEPDFSLAGVQEVELLLTDEGNNETTLKSQLFLSIVKPELFLEAGENVPETRDFLVTDYKKEVTAVGLEELDTAVPGDYDIKIRLNHTDYNSTVHIRDTIAPVIRTGNISSFTGLKKKPEAFIECAEDVTRISFRYVNEPDFNAEGVQTVSIAATDEGDNETIVSARLTLVTDNEAPVITGVKDIVVIKGNPIAYKNGVTVSDNCTEGLSFIVDTSKVVPGEIGIYPIVYIARDASGNETRIDATVNVKALTYDENTIFAIADSILAGIIRKGMSPMEKTRAIYDYLKRSIRYKRQTNYTDYLKAAYDGFTTGRGDCFIYSSTARVLLSRAGITVMQINKIPADTVHYWDLVNLGSGWYHFDACPMRDDRVFFMWSDNKLMDYSNSHNKSHNYDRSKYPVVNPE